MFDIWSLLFFILGLALGYDKSREKIVKWFKDYINKGKYQIDKKRDKDK